MEKLQFERLVKDIKFVKDQIEEIKININEIHDDIHPVRPEYLRKLKRIEKGKFKTYSSVDHLRKEIENV